jgi:hypothetical protein
MKEVIILRHGEKDAAGVLTERGEQAAEAMRRMLPHFVSIVSSPSGRAVRSAELLTGREPRIDKRAGFAMAPPEVSAAINALASAENISFLDAARKYNDPEVLHGIDQQAHELNTLIDELLNGLGEEEKALVVSHDLTIAPAMGFRGMSAESIEPLGGYVVGLNEETPSVRRYEVPQIKA